MKLMKRWIALALMILLWASVACAEEYVTIVQLRQQMQECLVERWVQLPTVEHVPVLTVQTDNPALENPLLVKVGAFDESRSGRFVKCVRYGKTPSHTALKNGLTLEEAQTVLHEELGRHVNKGIDDYGLIWTEIAEWKNMETWLLYYGQRFAGLTCFSAGLTMDARTADDHYMIIPNYAQQDVRYEDVPLASWTKIKASVDAYLAGLQSAAVDALELGYWMQEKGAENVLLPVWRLAYTTSKGYKECYFNAQTAEVLNSDQDWNAPEAFGWDEVK